MEAESVIHPLINAGVKPALIWAACKTGRLVSEENRDALTEEDIHEWENALLDYQEKYPNNDWDMKNLDQVIDREKF
jgi:hypothetical protein